MSFTEGPDPLSRLYQLTAQKDYVPRSAGHRAGSTAPDVRRLQRYLQRYGYFSSPAQRRAAGPTPGVFDAATVDALERYQEFHGLPVTSELDEATLDLMRRPRCGFPDNQVAAASRDRPIMGFTLAGSSWTHTNLTYAFQNYTLDLTSAEVSAACADAFALWAAVTPLTFTEVALGASPDIVIEFAAGAHGDGWDFDGPGGNYAHAFYPPPLGGVVAGEAHFDEDETWSVDLPPSGIDLVSIAAHEFGHALGLDHSAVTSALMWPTYGGPHRYLDADDVAGIQSLYGAPPAGGSSFTDGFERLSLGSDWADDGPIVFQDSDWVRGGQFLSGGAWQVDENNTAGVGEVAMGSIRRTDDNCDDQYIEAVVGNFFQGHDPSVDEWFQWVEGDVFLFAQCSPGSDVSVGAHFIIHANTGAVDGEAFVEFFNCDESGELTFADGFGSLKPLPAGWQANPDYTIRFEATAAGHLKAFFEGDLLAETDVTPAGGRHVAIGMQWNRTDYAAGEPNPGVSFRVESVTGSLCGVQAAGWRVGRVGWGSSPW